MVQQESDLPVDLSAPAKRALIGSGYLQLEQLANVREAEIEGLHGVGPRTLKQLRTALEARGLSFAATKGGKE